MIVQNSRHFFSPPPAPMPFPGLHTAAANPHSSPAFQPGMGFAMPLHGQQQQQQQQQVVETREFQRVVHSHSPTWQAVTSSTVRQTLVHQAAAPPPQQRSFALEELPADDTALDSQSQQQQWHHGAPPQIQQQQQQQQSEPGLDLDAWEGGDPPQQGTQDEAGPSSSPDRAPSAAAAPAAAATEPIKRFARRRSSLDGSKSAGPRRRELAALMGPDCAATMPYHLAQGEEHGEGVFEVTRFGRPRVKPLAYWSSERLVVGPKVLGASGIDRGSTYGDLLGLSSPAAATPAAAAGGGGSAPAGRTSGASARGVHPSATPSKRGSGGTPATARGRGKGRGRGRGRSSSRNAAAAEAASSPDEDSDDDVDMQAGMHSVGVRGGQTAAQRASKGPVSKQQRTSALPPSLAYGGASLAALAAAAGAEAAAMRHTASAAAVSGPSDADPGADYSQGGGGGSQGVDFTVQALPEVPDVPAEVMFELAAMTPAERPRKCGHCRACMQPSRKKACEAVRALQPEDYRPRRSSSKKKGVASGGPASATPAAVGGSSSPVKAAGRGKRAVEVLPMGELSESEPEASQPGQGRKRGRQGKAAAVPADLPRRSMRQRTAPARAPAASHGGSDDRAQSEDPSASEGPAPSGGTGAGGHSSSALWTAEQAAALQRAWLEVPPTADNFWQRVAATVPGRTADECFAKLYEKHPTPPARKGAASGLHKYLAPAPAFKAGASKAATHNAARKYARQARWQQRADEIAAVNGDEGELQEEAEEQHQRDRYIDQILRKRRGKALGVGALQHTRPAPAQGKGQAQARKLDAAEAARGVQAALVAGGQQAGRDSGEESDYYWSDAE